MTSRRGFLGMLAAAPFAAPSIAKAALENMPRFGVSGGWVTAKPLSTEAIATLSVRCDPFVIQRAFDDLDIAHHSVDAVDYLMKGCEMITDHIVITDDMPPRVKAMLSMHQSPPLAPAAQTWDGLDSAKLSDRHGDFMQTASGKAFYPLDPRPEEIDIRDIAAALSKLCRYGGHTLKFYSVAEHCVHIARAAPDGLRLVGLMHDASEAYLSDIIRPIKPFLSNYMEIEARLEAVIARRFSYQHPMPAEIKRLDNAILADERDQAMAKPPKDWRLAEPALGVELQFWAPEKAEYEFLAAFRRYGGHWCC